MRLSTTSLILGPLRGSEVGAHPISLEGFRATVELHDGHTIVVAGVQPDSLTITFVRIAGLPLLR